MTSTELAVHNQQHQPAAALAIQPGQVEWDKYQLAALSQIGLKDASNADRAVFLHQCQRTGLDPFAKQIYMIPRPEKQRDGSWDTKWTIQTGIDGWRVIRDRAERRAGVRGVLGRAIWYDDDANEFKVWVRRDAPAACEITYTVVDATGETPYTSVLQFAEYAQTKDGKLIAQWASKGSHMLEKCVEADVYRKAFPQDFAGLALDDAMPPAEDMTGEQLDAAYAKTTRRVTAADIRGRTRPQVRAEIVRDPSDASPAGRQEPPGPAAPSDPPSEPAGDAPDHPGHDTPDTPGTVKPTQLTAIWTILSTVYGFSKDEKDQARAVCGHIASGGIESTKDMSYNEARLVLDTLSRWRAEADEQNIPPREYLIGVMAGGEATGDE